MFNLKSREDMINTAKTFIVGGSFIMCLWVLFPFLIRTFLDPVLGGFRMGSLRWIGGSVAALGYVLAVWCVMLFINKGKGTPLPFAYPKQLVVCGPYKFVRNPMVVGTVLFLIGSSLLFGSYGIFIYAILIFLVMHHFILIEEKSLEKRFGVDYVFYFQKTPRWFPNLKK